MVLAELLAGGRPLDRHVEGALRAADALRRHRQARGTEPGIGDVEAVMHFAEHLTLVHPRIVERQLAVVEAAMADRTRALGDGEARRVLVDQETGDQLARAALGLLDAGSGEQDDVVRDIGVGDEVLGAGDDEIVAILDRTGLHRLHVGARIGLGDAEAFDALAADRRQEIALLLLGIAGAQDVARAMHRVLQGEAGAAELALHQGEGDMVEPAAA